MKHIDAIISIPAAILLAAFGIIYFAVVGTKLCLIWLWRARDYIFIALALVLAVMTLILLNTDYQQAGFWTAVGAAGVIIYLLVKWDQDNDISQN